MTDKERKVKVYHTDLWGLRKDKYRWLEQHDQASTKWQSLRPQSEFYLFIPRDEQAQKRYSRFVKITDIFPISTTGIKTHRDHFVIDFDKEALKRRIRTFLDPNLPDEFVRETFNLKDSRTWKLAKARMAMRKDKEWDRKIACFLYRPLDLRRLLYHSSLIERGRERSCSIC
jgi:predicted helicase